MKKRDLYWVNRILLFLLITLIFGAISIFNILQFNSTYMQEEREELFVSKRQIEWAVTPILKQKNFSLLQEYCNDFKDEDVEFRIFDENKNFIASSNPDNKTPLLEKNSRILRKNYGKYGLYKRSLKDRKIGLREKFYVDNHKYYLEITVSQADVMKSIVAAQRGSIMFFALGILFFISGLIQVFYNLRNAFNKLEDSVIDVANGNLDADIEIPKLGLLKELTLSIKKMTNRLKTQIERLTQLEQYKSNFLQNVTHEIKTPITAINSAIELLETRDSVSQEDRECYEIIQFQVKAIDKLVNDILQLSEIEVAKTNENKKFTSFNLNSMLEKVIGYFNFSDIKLSLIADADVDVYADEELLSTAVTNLISNAIKYSGTDKIDVILNRENLIIKDYGIGIGQEHLSHLFERFYRVDKTRSRKLGGSGLGLAIVKNIMELHNGRVSVESEPEKGTSFILTISQLLNT